MTTTGERQDSAKRQRKRLEEVLSKQVIRAKKKGKKILSRKARKTNLKEQPKICVPNAKLHRKPKIVDGVAVATSHICCAP